MLEARQSGRGDPGASNAATARAVPARSGTVVPDVLVLWEQACGELAALDAAFLKRGEGACKLRAQLVDLARTIARLGETAQRLEQEAARMRHVAYHDALTGLPNRNLLLDRLDRALAQAARNGGQVALLMLDLDAFKFVNDRFGHVVGDRLLEEVAQRLRASTREADTICRYGGDEFVILLPQVDGRRGAADVARKIQSRLAGSFEVGGRAIPVSACLGIALYPMDGVTPAELLQRADAAMYGSKDDSTRRVVANDAGSRF